eukprot:tig00000144_g8998.t1
MVTAIQHEYEEVLEEAARLQEQGSASGSASGVRDRLCELLALDGGSRFATGILERWGTLERDLAANDELRGRCRQFLDHHVRFSRLRRRLALLADCVECENQRLREAVSALAASKEAIPSETDRNAYMRAAWNFAAIREEELDVLEQDLAVQCAEISTQELLNFRVRHHRLVHEALHNGELQRPFEHIRIQLLMKQRDELAHSMASLQLERDRVWALLEDASHRSQELAEIVQAEAQALQQAELNDRNETALIAAIDKGTQLMRAKTDIHKAATSALRNIFLAFLQAVEVSRDLKLKGLIDKLQNENAFLPKDLK